MSYSDAESDTPSVGHANQAAVRSSTAVDSPTPATSTTKVALTTTDISKREGDQSFPSASSSSPQWSSPLCDLCCEHSEPSDHLLSYLLPCIALGIAKQKADRTSILFNALCFPVCCTTGAYSLVRIGYGVEGSARSDVLVGTLVPCCAVRRLYTETRVRPDPQWIGEFGVSTEDWGEEMGSFNDCQECARSIFCPCFVAHEVHTRLQIHSEMPTNRWVDYMCLLPCSMYGQTRVTYGIAAKECVCEDYCCGCVFYPCGLNRALREASRREMTMRQRAYAAGAGAAGKTRQGLRLMAVARESAFKVVAKEVVARSVSRPLGMQ